MQAEGKAEMTGRVFLVGAGPGDPDLMTVRATRVLQAAEVVVYDRLVSTQILDLIPYGASRLDVGKQPRNHPVPQDDINTLLINLARTGRRVVRLKGGDPLMFGRGGEEALALREAGIAYEIVPGITAAQGTAASLNLPLTHRGTATGVRYLTGHCRADGKLDFDWTGLSDPQTTLVVYMGLANIGEIAGQLMAHGRAGDTPVMAVSKATRADERQVVATLADIAGAVARADLESPVLFIVGEVVELAALPRDVFDDPKIAHLVAGE